MVLYHQAVDASQFMWREPGRRGQDNRFQPELGKLVTVLGVHVRQLVPLVAEEEEPIPLDPQNGRRHRREGQQCGRVR